MKNTYLAPEGMVYRNIYNGYLFKFIKLGITDTIDNYELIPEPEPEEPEEDNDNGEFSDPV